MLIQMTSKSLQAFADSTNPFLTLHKWSKSKEKKTWKGRESSRWSSSDFLKSIKYDIYA